MNNFAEPVAVLAGKLLKSNFRMSTAESCTGGLISHLLTNEPGSSEWYLGGVTAYSNELKMKALDVDEKIFELYGAVSAQCVEAMAIGVSVLTGSEVSIAVSGIAGPGGGTPEKPVGTVYICWRINNDIWWERNQFAGSRMDIKCSAAWRSLQVLVDRIR